MPQHRISRFRLRSHWMTAVIVAVALAAGVVQPDQSALAGTANGSALLSLPWAPGEAWRITGGAHSETGTSERPWSAIDFQPVDGKPGGKVRAARGGRVVRPCANWVILRHADGWSTSYYHLRGIRVEAGDWAERGQLLGYTSTAAGCGGYATGPHVHFSLMRDKTYVNIRNHVIGGWTVREGPAPYEGCLVKNEDRRCAPSSLIFNDGSVGMR